MFYEAKHSFQNDLIKIESNSNFSFPAHLHNSFELIAVTEGEMTITVDKKQYSLSAGNCVLVFPNQIHALHTEHTSSHKLCIFSGKTVQAFLAGKYGKLPLDNLFSPSQFYLNQLWELYGSNDILKIKGILYCLCSEFESASQYHDRDTEAGDLLHRIFSFVESNFRSDCSLSSLSAHTAYHPVYLSRYFKQCTGLSFTDHVNRYRINEAAYMLKNSNRKILDIALECGFDSLRSFNRNFKAIMGIPPKEYRKK